MNNEFTNLSGVIKLNHLNIHLKIEKDLKLWALQPQNPKNSNNLGTNMYYQNTFV